jgi:phosphate:Na+ symporter
MEVDWFKDILVPVIGGLGIFMLGLEFMTSGIQSLSVSRMRKMLARAAGTPITGLVAGTLITGVIQSSTAMTVMVVGLVDAGVLALRPAIAVIMGANVGTTLTNALIALPLGPLGLLVGGFFALIWVFGKTDKTKNIALACMGFALIFYGLSLMTGGLRPLRNIPEVVELIRSLSAQSYAHILFCVAVAAIITALIHSSSATIGIVMGLGAAGVISWETALAFSLGADLGTTITSFIASLNLSRNAKRAAYAHIAFNFIGVAIMLPLFPFMIQLVPMVVGDIGRAVVVDGVETYPLVPVAVGAYSTAFNIFNVMLLFPFVGVFERVLMRVGRHVAEDVEDYSQAKYLNPDNRSDMDAALGTIQQEMARHLQGTAILLEIAEKNPNAPDNARDHFDAIDILSREIRNYTASLFRPDLSPRQTDLLASLIEEADFAASLGEVLFQLARRIESDDFSAPGLAILHRAIAALRGSMSELISGVPVASSTARDNADQHAADLLRLRADVLALPEATTSLERGALLALLGSTERAFFVIARVHMERQSVEQRYTANIDAAMA